MNTDKICRQAVLTKWAKMIRECRTSGQEISVWTKEHGVSTNQYYYWQRQVKAACIESLQEPTPSFVELPINREPTELIRSTLEVVQQPAELIQNHAEIAPARMSNIKQDKAVSSTSSDIGAVIRFNDISIEIDNHAKGTLVKNLMEVLVNVKRC